MPTYACRSPSSCVSIVRGSPPPPGEWKGNATARDSCRAGTVSRIASFFPFQYRTDRMPESLAFRWCPLSILFTAHCPLSNVHRPLPTAHCSLSTALCLQTSYCPLLIVIFHCPLSVLYSRCIFGSFRFKQGHCSQKIRFATSGQRLCSC